MLKNLKLFQKLSCMMFIINRFSERLICQNKTLQRKKILLIQTIILQRMINCENNPVVFLITGLSGAGKSTLLRALEDEQYFTVDNVPPNLIEHFF